MIAQFVFDASMDTPNEWGADIFANDFARVTAENVCDDSFGQQYTSVNLPFAQGFGHLTSSAGAVYPFDVYAPALKSFLLNGKMNGEIEMFGYASEANANFGHFTSS